jgi:MYXO-CTERM domain-containing protein
VTQRQQTPEELRREIEQTRRELGETVDALSHKADIKEQARLKKEEVQERVKADPAPLAWTIGGLLGLLVLLRLFRRR